VRYQVQVCDLCLKEEKIDATTRSDWETETIRLSRGSTVNIMMCPSCEKDFIELRDTHYAEMKAFLGKFGFKDRT
jgi:hypothetical protein